MYKVQLRLKIEGKKLKIRSEEKNNCYNTNTLFKLT